MATKHILIYGGSGALGRSLVSHFTSLPSWKVVSVDRVPNHDAHTSISLGENTVDSTQWETTRTYIDDELTKANIPHLDALVCVAGGWCGGNVKSKDFLGSIQTSLVQSVQTSALAASLAAHRLNPHSLLVFTGSQAALSPTPGMIGYGMAKAAVHHLVASLGEPNAGLPLGVKVMAILPVTLDTPMNRKSMPNADTSSWTPLEHVAHKIGQFASDITLLPQSGTLLSVVTKEGVTSFVPTPFPSPPTLQK